MPKTGLYARLSLLREGQEGLAVARQLEDCREKAKALDWTVTEEYEDEDLSASKNVVRPDYDRMLADLESGHINAVICYDLDRLTRKPAELEQFIDMCDRLSVKLANVSGEVDLSTANGRMIARIKGAVARQESDRIGERVSRQKQQRAEMGFGLGSRFRTFGFSRSFEVIEDEAEVVREIFARVAAGESVQSVTDDLNVRGIPTTSGGAWRRTTLGNLIRRPNYAGLATLKGAVVGETQYPALVSEAVWTAAQRGGRGVAGFNSRVYLLSGIAICGLCHGPMYGSGREKYACKVDPDHPSSCGRVSIKRLWLDMAVLISLVGPSAREAESAEAEPDDRDFAAEVADVDRRIAELRAAHDRQELELVDLLPMLRAERERRGALLREQAVGVVEHGIEELAAMSLHEIADAPLSQRRALVRKYFQAIIVKPATTPGRRGFDPERVDVLWADGKVTKLPTAITGPAGFEGLAAIFGGFGSPLGT